MKIRIELPCICSLVFVFLAICLIKSIQDVLSTLFVGRVQSVILYVQRCIFLFPSFYPIPPLVRASEPENFWIYFENNKQDLWTSVFWLIRSSLVMKTECQRKIFYELRIIFKKRGKNKQTFATDKIWWLVKNFLFSSLKLKEKWIPTQCHWKRPFDENEKKKRSSFSNVIGIGNETDKRGNGKKKKTKGTID